MQPNPLKLRQRVARNPSLEQSYLVHEANRLDEIQAFAFGEFRGLTLERLYGFIRPQTDVQVSILRRCLEKPHVPRAQVVKIPRNHDVFHAWPLPGSSLTCTRNDPGTGSSDTT